MRKLNNITNNLTPMKRADKRTDVRKEMDAYWKQLQEMDASEVVIQGDGHKYSEPLEFWKEHGDKYPLLTKAVRIVFSALPS